MWYPDVSGCTLSTLNGPAYLGNSLDACPFRSNKSTVETYQIANCEWMFFALVVIGLVSLIHMAFNNSIVCICEVL